VTGATRDQRCGDSFGDDGRIHEFGNRRRVLLEPVKA